MVKNAPGDCRMRRLFFINPRTLLLLIRETKSKRKLCPKISRIIRILAPDESKRPRIKKEAFGWWLRRLTPLVLNGTSRLSLPATLSLSCSLVYPSPYLLAFSNFLSLALPPLSPTPARALFLTQGSEEDGQTTSRGFLKPATSAWNWLLTSRIDFHSLTASSPHAPRPPCRVLWAHRFVPSTGSFAFPRDHNFYPWHPDSRRIIQLNAKLKRNILTRRLYSITCSL